MGCLSHTAQYWRTVPHAKCSPVYNCQYDWLSFFCILACITFVTRKPITTVLMHQFSVILTENPTESPVWRLIRENTLRLRRSRSDDLSSPVPEEGCGECYIPYLERQTPTSLGTSPVRAWLLLSDLHDAAGHICEVICRENPSGYGESWLPLCGGEASTTLGGLRKNQLLSLKTSIITAFLAAFLFLHISSE